jgi:DNA-binding transcriptional MerR regulator
VAEVTQERDLDSLTIDELSRATGMTVRNIRAHQSRGLLPAPRVVGRTGYYGQDHVARLELIREMQADGFNLGSISRLLEGVGESSSDVLDFTRAVREPFEEEEPEILSAEELVQRWGDADPALLRRAERLGLLNPIGGGRYEAPSPRVLRAGGELAELGIPLSTALDVAAKLRRQSREVARVFIELFLENVWKPFEKAGRPEEEWPRVRESLERLRPLASESLLSIFQLVMTEATDKAFGRALERELSRGRKSSSRRSRRPVRRRRR